MQNTYDVPHLVHWKCKIEWNETTAKCIALSQGSSSHGVGELCKHKMMLGCYISKTRHTQIIEGQRREQSGQVRNSFTVDTAQNSVLMLKRSLVDAHREGTVGMACARPLIQGSLSSKSN